MVSTPPINNYDQLPQVDSNTQHSYESQKKNNVHVSEENSSDAPAIWWTGPSAFSSTWEFLGVVLSLCFLVLGICVITLRDKHETAWSNRVVQATQIAPSVWPIIFSGIVGNSIRALADWKVETGIELLTLEQLLGSLTMAGSVITIFRWNIFRISSAVLILLWAFNPLGSQASFRGIYLRPSFAINQGLVNYYNASLTTQWDLTTFCCAAVRSRITMRALYSSVFYDYVSSTQYVNLDNTTAKGIITLLGGDSSAAIQASTDNWGNVRIPTLEHLPDYNEKNPHGWVDVQWNKKMYNYSSLLGDRIEGVNRSSVSNASFIIESSYQSFSCVPWFFINGTTTTDSNSSTLRKPGLDKYLLQKTGRNFTAQFGVGSYITGRTFFASAVARNATSTPGVPELVFGSRGNDEGNWHLTTCTAKTVYVDANVTCISRGTQGKANCGVTALRQTANPPANTSVSILNNIPSAFNALLFFNDILGLDEFSGGSGMSSPTVQYLFDPLTAFATREISSGYTELSTLDIATFERRFQLMLNTLWKLSWAMKSAMGEKLSASRSIDGTNELDYATILNSTSTVSQPTSSVYAIDNKWMGVYFVSAAIMLAASVFALIVRTRCRAPSLLGYVSTMTRDSSYFQANDVQGKSLESGPSRTRRIGSMNVMIGDVSDENDEAGKIAFAPIGTGRRVEKARWYN